MQDKHNDIIDAEFFSDSEYTKKEYNSELKYSPDYQSFSYPFGKIPKINFKRPSLFMLFLLSPIFLIFIIFLFIVFGIAFVIFLPKIFNTIRKKGISGLKIHYNLLRGLFR